MFCDTIPTKPHDDMSVEEVDNYKSFLMMLDWRLRSIPVSTIVIGTSEMTMIMELYQLAALVYLNRVSEDMLDQPARTQQHINRAFSIFSELSFCKRQFPLFILGCEARTDDQRAIVLDLIARTEKRSSSRPIIQVKILIHAMWAQDDLADQEMNYWDKLSSIIGACSIMPSLV
jgi:Fungal specific transcription factor domain